MANDINTWLAGGCDYQVGLSILEKYGSNAFLLSLLKKSDSDFNRQKLSSELQGLLSSAPAEVAPARPALAPRPSAPVPMADPSPIDLDQPINHKPEPTLLQVVKQRDRTYSELRSLKALTVSTEEGPALKDLATRLVQLSKANALAWERYNYLTENPETEACETAKPPVMVDIRLIEKREQIRKSLNKAENRIKGEDKPKQKTLELITQRRQQLAEIDIKIADLKKGAEV